MCGWLYFCCLLSLSVPFATKRSKYVVIRKKISITTEVLAKSWFSWMFLWLSSSL